VGHVDHVISIAGAWDDSSDLFVAKQELEKQLAPGGCVEVLGPVGRYRPGSP
jgi:hypothetical protein